MRVKEPGTIPPPSKRSHSPMCERMRLVSVEETSFSFTGWLRKEDVNLLGRSCSSSSSCSVFHLEHCEHCPVHLICLWPHSAQNQALFCFVAIPFLIKSQLGY